MANDKETEIKKAPFGPKKEAAYMDSLTPGKAVPKRPYGGNLVKPEDRVANVHAPAPAEEPTGNLFTPDQSPNYSIRDQAPSDKK